jgi:hypothetical protein
VLHYKSNLHSYHIIYISLLTIVEESDFNDTLLKARAVCWWPPPSERLGEAFYSTFSESLISMILFEKRGLCLDGFPQPEEVGMGLSIHHFRKFQLRSTSPKSEGCAWFLSFGEAR